MKIRVKLPRSNPSIDPELLVKFVVAKCSETIESEYTEPPPVVVALALAAMSQDLNFYNRLKEVISSSSDAAENILKISQTFLYQLLVCSRGDNLPIIRKMKVKTFYRTSIIASKFYHMPCREGRRMLSEEDLRIHKSL